MFFIPFYDLYYFTTATQWKIPLLPRTQTCVKCVRGCGQSGQGAIHKSHQPIFQNSGPPLSVPNSRNLPSFGQNLGNPFPSLSADFIGALPQRRLCAKVKMTIIWNYIHVNFNPHPSIQGANYLSTRLLAFLAALACSAIWRTHSHARSDNNWEEPWLSDIFPDNEGMFSILYL